MLGATPGMLGAVCGGGGIVPRGGSAPGGGGGGNPIGGGGKPEGGIFDILFVQALDNQDETQDGLPCHQVLEFHIFCRLSCYRLITTYHRAW